MAVNASTSPLGAQVLQCCWDVLRVGHSGCLKTLHGVLPTSSWPLVCADGTSHAQACSVNVWAREQHKACRVYPKLYQLLCSYGTLMDNNNGFNCGPACNPGPWDSVCSGEHVYKTAGFVPIGGRPQPLGPHTWFCHMPFSAMGCLGLCGDEWRHLAHVSALMAAFGPTGVQYRLCNPYLTQPNNQTKQVNQILKPYTCCYINCSG